MHVQYGNYLHGPFEATLRVIPKREHTQIGQWTQTTIQFLIDGKLVASNPTDLMLQVNQLEQAYSVDGRDLWLRYPSPSSLIALHYRNDQSLTGILVKRPPSSVGFMGAEWACEYNYQIELEATYINTRLSPNFVVGFNSGLRRQGNGGPGFDLVPAKQGKWRKQITTATTPVRLFQYGEITGLSNYPRDQVPAPLFPDDLVPETDEYEEVQAASGQQTQFSIRFGYQFWRNGPFF